MCRWQSRVPPFETFYETHKAEVFRFLRGRLGPDRAEDAFQETFLRALRAYERLSTASTCARGR